MYMDGVQIRTVFLKKGKCIVRDYIVYLHWGII